MTPTENDPPRLTLCFVVDDDAVARFPTSLRFLMVGLIDENIDTVLVSPEGSRAGDALSGPVKIVPFRRRQWPLARWAWRRMAEGISSQLERTAKGRLIVVHGISPVAAPLACSLSAGLGADLVWTVSSRNEIEDPAVSAAIDQAAIVVAPRRELQEACVRRALQARVALIRPGVPCAATPSAFARADRDPVLIAVGPLDDRASLDLLLAAVRLTVQRHPSLTTFIVGKGPAESSLRYQAQQLGISDRVVFTGRLENWRAAVDGSDVFCLPAASSSFREEPLHALAGGLTVIAPDDTAVEGLVNEETAVLFRPGSSAHLAECLVALLADPARARQLASAGQAWARQAHSASQMVLEHIRIYRELASRRQTLSIRAG